MSKLARRLRKVELISKIFVSRILGGGRNGYVCPCCEKNIPYYKPYGTRNLRINAECPICRAAERDRVERLWLNRELDRIPELRILHFAPERNQYNFISKINKENYWPVDIDEKIDMIRQVEDITKISFGDGTFDLIICNQVLEHVSEANIAMQELSRVLKDDGVCLITVPIDEQHETLENAEINTDVLRIKYYGEANHVRMYGNDFDNILLSNGLKGTKIFARDLCERKLLRKAGLKQNEYFWLCKKYIRNI